MKIWKLILNKANKLH